MAGVLFCFVRMLVIVMCLSSDLLLFLQIGAHGSVLRFGATPVLILYFLIVYWVSVFAYYVVVIFLHLFSLVFLIA